MSNFPQSRRNESAINKNRHPCTNCKNQKLGCNQGLGDTPCSRCEKRGIPCIKATLAPVEVSRLRRSSTTSGHGRGAQRYPGERMIVDTFRIGTDVNSSAVTIYDVRGERYVSTTDLDENGHPLPMQKPDQTLEEYLEHTKRAGSVANQAYAGALRSLQHTSPYPDTPSQSTETPIALPAAMPPKLSLAEFCSAYKLSENIETVLSSHRITGPHALRFVTDSFLLLEMHLMMGEVADIRYAEESWKSPLGSAHRPAPFPGPNYGAGYVLSPLSQAAGITDN